MKTPLTGHSREAIEEQSNELASGSFLGLKVEICGRALLTIIEIESGYLSSSSFMQLFDSLEIQVDFTMMLHASCDRRSWHFLREV